MPTLANHSLGRAPQGNGPKGPPPKSQKRNRKPRRIYFWRRLGVLLVLGALIYGLIRGVLWGTHRASVAVRTVLHGKPTCDVLVVGGTPSGIAAALSAARGGSNVILLEERPRVGGDIPYAFLNMFDVPLKNARAYNVSPVAYGIFGEVFQKMGVAFDIEAASRLLDQMLAEDKHISVRCNVRLGRVLIEDGRVAGVVLDGAQGQEKITASVVVDATDDAQIAARAGAGYYLGRENANADKRMQAAGLLFSVQDVVWHKVRSYVRHARVVSLRHLQNLKGGSSEGIDVRVAGKSALIRQGGVIGRYAWERGDIIKDYVPRGKDIVVLSINFGRQDDGSVVLNTLNVVGVNGLSEYSRLKAIKEAKAEIPYLIVYLRHRMPGFANARLARIAPELYIRETRHIHGFYTLKVSDVKEGRPFWDRIALASYPLDLHPYLRGDRNPFGPHRYVYALPLRCLVPRKVDGLFVASRSLSATYSAAGSARVIPVTMAAGEAVGTAAAMCASEGLTPHKLVESPDLVAQLQDRLRAHGMNIGDELLSSNEKKVAALPMGGATAR